MKRLVAVLSILLLLAALAACGARPDPEDFLLRELAKAKTPADQDLEAGLETALHALDTTTTEESKALYLEFARAILDQTDYEILEIKTDDGNDTAVAQVKMTTLDFSGVLEKAAQLLLSGLAGAAVTDPDEMIVLQLEKMIEAVKDPALGTTEFTFPVNLKYDPDQKTWLLNKNLIEQSLTEAMSG